ncbi:hypothetical protein J6590_086003 [Homalodisca vitripennis]|nr:hypothetical protein J6590_086003 [Homalodisca vitripennis]
MTVQNDNIISALESWSEKDIKPYLHLIRPSEVIRFNGSNIFDFKDRSTKKTRMAHVKDINSVHASMEYFLPKLQPSSDELECLFPGQLINGDVINVYMLLLVRRSIFYATVPVTFSVDTFFGDLVKMGNDRVKGTEITGLFAIKPKLHLVRALNSLGHPRTKEIRVILAFLQRNATERKVIFDRDVWIICNTPDEYPKNATERDTPSGKDNQPRRKKYHRKISVLPVGVVESESESESSSWSRRVAVAAPRYDSIRCK